MKGQSNINNMVDLMGIYQNFHPDNRGSSFFIRTHGKFRNICHVLAYNVNINKSHKVELLKEHFLNTMQ